jgi:hypothetical protein
MVRVVTPFLILVPTVLAFVSVLPNSWWQEYEMKYSGSETTSKVSLWKYDQKTVFNTTKSESKGDHFGGDDSTCGDGGAKDCCPYLEATAGMILTVIVFSTIVLLMTCFTAPTTTKYLAGSALFFGFVLTTATCALWYDKLDNFDCVGTVSSGLEHHDERDYRIGFWMALGSAVLFFVNLVVFILFRKTLVPMQGNVAASNAPVGSLHF